MKHGCINLEVPVMSVTCMQILCLVQRCDCVVMSGCRVLMFVFVAEVSAKRKQSRAIKYAMCHTVLPYCLILPELVLQCQIVIYTLHSPGVHKSQVSCCPGG
jgi:hypothetical protein